MSYKVKLDIFEGPLDLLLYLIKKDEIDIQDIAIDEADRELVSATVVMAHALGLKVVAEGVETASQLDILRRLGCDFAQGYLFARPMPAGELAAYLEAAPSTI